MRLRVLVVMFVFAFLVVLLGENDAAAPASNADATKAGADPLPAAGSVVEVAPAEAVRVAVESVVPPPRPKRNPVRPMDTILVLDDATGLPVPGAEVHVVTGHPGDERDFFADNEPACPDFEAAARNYGEVLRTGADGCVRVSQVGWLCANVRAGNLTGALRARFDRFEPRTQPSTVRIRPEVELRVRVVGPDGLPRAGQNVVLDFPAVGPFDSRVVWERIELPPTDASGLTRLRDAAVRTSGVSTGDPACVRLEYHSRTTFVLDPVPTEPVELRIEPRGSIAVRLCDASGRPWSLPVPRCSVDVAPIRTADGKRALGGLVSFAPDGIATVGHLELMRDWQVSDRTKFLESVMARGPVVDGEVVRIDLCVAQRTLVVHGVLRGPDGTPLARPFLVAGQKELEPHRAAADGGFCLFFGEAESSRTELRLVVKGLRREPTFSATIALPNGLRPGIQDLGTITLQLESAGR